MGNAGLYAKRGDEKKKLGRPRMEETSEALPREVRNPILEFQCVRKRLS